MKIALFCGGYPPDRTGGVQSNLKQIREGLEERGHEVWVVTPRFGSGLTGPRDVCLSLPDPVKHEKLHYAAWAWACWSFLRKNRFDVCSGHQIWGNIACLVSGQKWVLTPHNFLVPNERWLGLLPHRMNYWLTRKAFAKAEQIIAISDALKEDVEDRVPKARGKVSTVYYGVETDYFSPAERKKRGGKKRVLFLGRLKPDKGIETVLQAFEALAEKRMDVECIVVGAGGTDYMAYLKGRYPPATFVGQVPRQETLEHYRAADVYVIFAPTEGFCLSLAEAMSCGLPAVCSDIPTYREVTQGKAFFAREGDAKDLARVLNEVLDRTDLVERGRAMREIALRYSVERNVSGYERVLKEVAGAGTRGREGRKG